MKLSELLDQLLDQVRDQLLDQLLDQQLDQLLDQLLDQPLELCNPDSYLQQAAGSPPADTSGRAAGPETT